MLCFLTNMNFFFFLVAVTHAAILDQKLLTTNVTEITHFRSMLARKPRLEIQKRLRIGTQINDIAQYPFLVSIQVPSAEIFAGTGVILNKYWALASGAAVNNIKNVLSTVRLYTNSADVSSSTLVHVHRVTRVKVHEGFDATTLVNNVGVMRACPPFVTSSFVHLPMPSSPPLADSVEGVIVSWLGDGTALYEFSTTTDSDNNCLNSDSSVDLTSVGTQFCSTGGAASPVCEPEDIGAPFFVSGIVVGLANTAQCMDTIPDVFTDLSHFVTWIQNHSQD